jgi:hypothetical protein
MVRAFVRVMCAVVRVRVRWCVCTLVDHYATSGKVEGDGDLVFGVLALLAPLLLELLHLLPLFGGHPLRAVRLEVVLLIVCSSGGSPFPPHINHATSCHHGKVVVSMLFET